MTGDLERAVRQRLDLWLDLAEYAADGRWSPAESTDALDGVTALLLRETPIVPLLNMLGEGAGPGPGDMEGYKRCSCGCGAKLPSSYAEPGALPPSPPPLTHDFREGEFEEVDLPPRPDADDRDQEEER